MKNELLDLALSDDWSTRLCAATSEELTLEVVELLKDDDDNDVRGGLTDNPRTPVAVLEWMCQHDTDLMVMLVLSGNPNTSAKGLEYLYERGSVEVNNALVWHPNVSEHIKQSALNCERAI